METQTRVDTMFGVCLDPQNNPTKFVGMVTRPYIATLSFLQSYMVIVQLFTYITKEGQEVAELKQYVYSK